jgi:hypothetical protein
MKIAISRALSHGAHLRLWLGEQVVRQLHPRPAPRQRVHFVFLINCLPARPTGLGRCSRCGLSAPMHYVRLFIFWWSTPRMKNLQSCDGRERAG